VIGLELVFSVGVFVLLVLSLFVFFGLWIHIIDYNLK